MTSMPSLFASDTAMRSCCTSTTNSASGKPPMSFIPPRLRCSFSMVRRFSQRLLLGQHLERAVVGLRLKFLEVQDRLPDRLVVGQHATEPTLVDVGHADAFGLFPDDLCSGALGADKQDLLVCGDKRANVVESLVERGQRVFEIDYVNSCCGHRKCTVPSWGSKSGSGGRSGHRPPACRACLSRSSMYLRVGFIRGARCRIR